MSSLVLFTSIYQCFWLAVSRLAEFQNCRLLASACHRTAEVARAAHVEDFCALSASHAFHDESASCVGDCENDRCPIGVL
jgi:hypothetical protein